MSEKKAVFMLSAAAWELEEQDYIYERFGFNFSVSLIST